MNFLEHQIISPLATRVMDWLNPVSSMVEKPFDPSTSIQPPGGVRSSWVHYGVMVPGLPEPHRSFGLMAIVGSPGVQIFANDHAIKTTPRDTAYAVSATGAMTGGQFRSYSIEQECDFAGDGSQLRFGSDILLTGTFPRFRIQRWHPEVEVDLHLRATDRVAHFFKLRGGLYDHWSLLCEYDGEINGSAVSGLCTYEYAHGVGLHSFPNPLRLNAPAKFFTYHVLNLDEENQLLFGQATGPAGLEVIRSASLRSRSTPNAQLRNAHFEVTSWSDEPAVTASGDLMRVPEDFKIRVHHDNGAVLVDLSGTANQDWAPGLGAGVVGSYEFEATFKGREVSGGAYLEWVDLRTEALPPPVM